jgi:hypothetical protein
MLKYLIYLVTMFIIIYFQFVGTDMQKKSDLKIVQEYLSIPVPIDTINTANQFRLGDSSFVIWSDLYGHKKNIEFTKEQLKKNGWELEKTNKYNTSNVYYFKKNNLYYKVFNSLKTNEWSEDIGYKK